MILIMIITKSFINIYFLHLFLFIFDHTTHCRIQSNALPISLQLTTIHPRLSELRRTRDFPSDETARHSASPRLGLATGGWRAAARCRPVSTHARHTADLATTAQVQHSETEIQTTRIKTVRIRLLNNRTYTPHP